MNYPAVSVIMPVRNGGDYLNEAVQSILSQVGVELELIMVDDHSNDGALQRLAPDRRITLLRSKQRGIVPALNLALKAAKHSIIARMDCDDIAAPLRLKTQIDYLIANPEIDIVGAKVELFCDSAELGKGYTLYQDWINQHCSSEEISNSFFVESCIPHPTALFRRSMIDELGGYHDTAWPEDYDLWCRAHLAGKRFAKPSGKPLLRWRDHPSRASRVQSRYKTQQFLTCKAFYLAKYLRARNIRQAVIWGAGPTGLKLHDLLSEHGIEILGFIDVNQKLIDHKRRNKSILVLSSNAKPSELQSIDSLILTAVGARGARNRITKFLRLSGRRVQQDYICMA